jgi:hypothetical protein
MLSPQSAVEERRDASLRRLCDVNDDSEPAISELGNLLDEVPCPVVMILDLVGFFYGPISPLRPNPPLLQHVTKMTGVLHAVNVPPSVSDVTSSHVSRYQPGDNALTLPGGFCLDTKETAVSICV